MVYQLIVIILNAMKKLTEGLLTAVVVNLILKKVVVYTFVNNIVF